MKVILFGGTGLLGTSLQKHLSGSGIKDVLAYSRQGGRPLDLSSVSALRDEFKKQDPSIVINLAALANVDECEEHPLRAYQQNAATCANLREASGAHLPIIHVSTDQLYDGEGDARESEVSPLNYYAYSKLMGEQYLGENTAILRTNFFGKSLSAKPSFSDWIFRSLTADEPVNLFTDSYFNPLNLGTLSALILRVMKGFKPGVYNLGSRKGLSKYEFGRRFAVELGLDATKINPVLQASAQLKARRPRDMRMNIEKFEKCFEIILPTLESQILSECSLYRKGVA